MKRNKNDAADAAAIAEAVTRPSMRFVAVEIRPMRALPPVEFCLGTRPIQAASSRPVLNTKGSDTEATRALAMIGPTPGMLARFRLAWFGRCQTQMRRSAKQGDPYLRWLLVAGAMAVIRHGRKTGFRDDPWLADLIAGKPAKVAAVALANKNARTAWALLARGETYCRQAVRT